eukprot:scaffold120662_cov32-Prasinocladus_malaysianus.AAC.1
MKAKDGCMEEGVGHSQVAVGGGPVATRPGGKLRADVLDESRLSDDGRRSLGLGCVVRIHCNHRACRETHQHATAWNPA